MPSGIYSNAFNFSTYVNGGVDLRTGQYGVNINLATLVSQFNDEVSRDISLSFSMMNNVNSGFGIGWSLNNSEYYDNKVKPQPEVHFSSGETYQVQPFVNADGRIDFKDKKLKDAYIGKIDERKICIVYKSGMVETLSRVADGKPFLLTRLQFENGEKFDFQYNSVNPDLLANIVDGYGKTILRLISNDNKNIHVVYVRMAEDKEAKIEFVYVNNKLITLKLPSDGIENPPQTTFSYNELNDLLVITSVDNPTGSRDNIYYQQNGHRVGKLSKTSYIPYVLQWDRFPGGGQPMLRMKYTYSPDKNFTGYPFNGNPSSVADNLYLMPGNYEYWANETIVDAEENDIALRSHKVTYNKFHLTKEEVYREKNCETKKVTIYNEISNTDFFSQPPNLQIPKSITTEYTNANGKRRSETLTQESDEYGNITETVDISGVKTVFDYYPVQGDLEKCPSDPFGQFKRYIRMTNIIPSGDMGETKTVNYEYQSVAVKQGISFLSNYVVIQSKAITNDILVEEYAYQEDEDVSLNALLSSSTRTYLGDAPKTTTKNFSYTLIGGSLTTVETTIGFDGKQMEESETINLYTSLMQSHTDTDGITEKCEYDILGRLIKKISAAGSLYETINICRYILPSAFGKTSAIEVIDIWGVIGRTEYDGFGREVFNWVQDDDGKFDAEGNYDGSLRKMASSTYDKLGRLTSETDFDYIDGQQVAMNQKNYVYDGWEQIAEVHHNTGLIELNIIDPVAMTQTESQRNQNAQQLASTRTTFNLFEQPIKIEELDGQTLYSTTTMQYDGFGRLVKTIKPDGSTSTVEQYDIFDRPLLLTQFDGTVNQIDYSDLTEDVVPTAINVKVGGNFVNIGTQGFDGLGRLINLQVNRAHKQYQYSASTSWPSSIINGRNQQVNVNTLPELGYVMAVNAEKSERALGNFNYSDAKTPNMPAGIPLSAINAFCRYDYTYGQTGSLKTVRQTVGAVAKNTAYNCVTLGGTALDINMGGRVLKKGLDSFGRVITTTDGNITTQCTYDTFERINSITTLQNGVQVQSVKIDYDVYNRETHRTITSQNDQFEQTSTYDTQDRLIERTTLIQSDKRLSEVFAYDERSRLVSYVIRSGYDVALLPCNELGRPITEQLFQYDGLNNLVQVTTTFVNGECDIAAFIYEIQRITSISHTLTTGENAYPATVSIEYDDDGNITSINADGGTGPKLAYSATSQLIQYGDTVYRYDAYGKLIKQGRKANYYLDGKIVSESGEAGELKFIRHGDVNIAETDTESRFLMTDNQGSTIGVKDASGTNYFSYTPFGSSADKNVRSGFKGELLDTESGGYPMGNGVRLYLPSLAGFTSMDSLSPFISGGFNPYRYCDGDPINLSDPSGYMSTGSIIGSVLGIIGAIIGIALAIPTGGASLTLTAAIEIGLGVAELTATGVSLGLGLAGDEKGSDIAGAIAGVFGLASMGMGGASWLMGKAGAKGGKAVVSGAEELRGTFSKLPGKSVKTKPMSKAPKKIWHKVKEPTPTGHSKYVFGSNRPISHRHLEEPIKFFERRHSVMKRPIYILTGSHGARMGNNWTSAGVRRASLIEKRFFKQDLRYIGRVDNRIRVRNMDGMSTPSFNRYISDPNKHVILGYCFGRNDEALRYYRNLKPVTSYV